MEVSSIPKSFWHSISIAILVVTFGLVAIAYRSTSVSIEIANTKINLSSAINETELLSQELQRENEQLIARQNELLEKIQTLETMLEEGRIRDLSADEIQALKPAPDQPQQAIKQSARLKELDARIKGLKRVIKE